MVVQMTKSLVYVPQAECQRLRSNPVAFAAACRINTLSMITEAGAGHIGASFSSMDILVHLYLHVVGPEDVVILSRGHEVPAWYAIQIGLGELPEAALHQLRKPGGLPGHPEIGTPGVPCNTGSLGMGISKARGMMIADRLRGELRRYFVLVGDGELQEGQSSEALRIWDRTGHDQLPVVIVDGNGLQSDGPTLSLRGGLGWTTRAVDGHDYDALAQINTPGPVISRAGIFWARTTKGKGVSFMESNPRWHSGAPLKDEYRAAIRELQQGLEIDYHYVPFEWPAPRKPNPLIEAYSCALVELAERDQRIVVLDADLARDCGLLPFILRFPERFVECGIAEQNMVSIASGLALRGFIPICHSFAAFLTRRAHDQIWNQVSEGTKVIYVGSMAGELAPNGPGISHYSGADDDLMARLMRVRSPTGPESVAEILASAVRSIDPVYIRLGPT